MSNKNEVEALLFSSARAMSLDEIARICRADAKEVEKSLNELREEYEQNKRPLLLIQDGTKWRLTVREGYSHIVDKVVTQAELTKTLIETLAVIAWKAPVLQSDVIKVRTNKAYEHIAELVESGFISKKRHGRSYMLGLAQKFYDYFDLRGKEEFLKKLKPQQPGQAAKATDLGNIEETKVAIAKLFEAVSTGKPGNEE